MNTRQGKRKAYVKLETAVIVISENESLLAGSGTNIGGEAGSAPDDGTLNAKEFDFFSDEEENSASKD
ncbi:MAG: hypothetical protein ACFNKM_06765 [Prevotella nigrescens]|jgi:hypothetical protein